MLLNSSFENLRTRISEYCRCRIERYGFKSSLGSNCSQILTGTYIANTIPGCCTNIYGRPSFTAGCSAVYPFFFFTVPEDTICSSELTGYVFCPYVFHSHGSIADICFVLINSPCVYNAITGHFAFVTFSATPPPVPSCWPRGIQRLKCKRSWPVLIQLR